MEVLTIVLLVMLVILVGGLVAVVIWLGLQSRDQRAKDQIAALQAEMRAMREQVGQSLGTVTQQVAVFGSV